MLVEIMGQCQRCKDLLTIELEQMPDRRNAHVHLRGQYYRIREGRTYRFIAHTQRLEHQGIVTPCRGAISLRGGLTPLPLLPHDELYSEQLA